MKKTGKIKATSVDENDLEVIRQFSLLDEINKDKIFCFKVSLCNNEIDRDTEVFSTECLKGLAELFVGKTGVKDHNWKSENQIARIFKTEVVISETEKTSYGEPFSEIIAHAYMVRNASNEDLIADIEMGIKKEVSIACSVSKATCSICGKDFRTERCEHTLGESYGEKKCFAILSDPIDAYEWSFVAVPAQKDAGITKSKEAGEREPYPEPVVKNKKEKSKKTIKSTLISAFSI